MRGRVASARREFAGIKEGIHSDTLMSWLSHIEDNRWGIERGSFGVSS